MKQTKSLTEGALLLAILAVMMFISAYVPVLSLIVQLFVILPFVVYSSKYELKYSIVFMICSIFISFLIGSFFTMSLTFLYGSTGLCIGYFIQRRESKLTIYIASSIVFLFSLVLLLVIAASFFQLNFIAEYEQYFKEFMDQYREALTLLGQTPTAEMEEQLMTIFQLFITMTPSLLISTAFISVLLFIIINFPILKRLGIEVPKFGPFRNFLLPKSIIWIYLVVLLLSFMVDTDSSNFFQMAVINASFILQILIILQGLSFIFYFAFMKKWSKAVPIIAVICTFIIPFFLSIVRLLGIIDIGFDLRQRLKT